MVNAKLEIKKLSYCYTGERVLTNISFIVPPAHLFSIVGPNGTGKTTLIKCLNLILKPETGKILLEGQNINLLHRRLLAKRIGYVPQKVNMNLPVTVFDMVMMGRRPYQKWKFNAAEYDKVWLILRLLNLKQFALKAVAELSGGQQQKVNIACALAQEPDILLLDEPTSNLDISHQLAVMELLKSLTRTTGLTVVTAIHDLNIAARFSDTILMLKSGSIQWCSPPKTAMTPDNIRTLYGIDAKIFNHNGSPYIVPVTLTWK